MSKDLGAHHPIYLFDPCVFQKKKKIKKHTTLKLDRQIQIV